VLIDGETNEIILSTHCKNTWANIYKYDKWVQMAPLKTKQVGRLDMDKSNKFGKPC
jgi:hypothetical protein